jgi:hypothetical protein
VLDKEVIIVTENGVQEKKICKGNCEKCNLRYLCITSKPPIITEKAWTRNDVTRGTGKTLREWRMVIKRERGDVGIRPYSHNIIMIALQAISRGWGQNKANKAIDDYGLEHLGWSKILDK